MPSSTSSDTPCQVVSSLDQRVTQWMSLVSVSVGRARNSSQVQLFVSRPPVMENDQPDSGVCGVGPADRTGKSRVTYCPGGTRPAGASSRLRWKPREIGLTTAGYANDPERAGFHAVASRYTFSPMISIATRLAATTTSRPLTSDPISLRLLVKNSSGISANGMPKDRKTWLSTRALDGL